MNDEKLLADLAPPSGGWQRLTSRRDVPPRLSFGIPLAAAATLALVFVFARPEAQVLQLPWNGGRLVAQPSEGSGLREVAKGQITPMPSADPDVQFYWLTTP